jgi:endonuclease/exonuclease/phosphatase family metal-dependent hydrolase
MPTVNKKKKSLFNKILYILSIGFAFLLVVSYLLPYIEPKALKGFAALSLFTPFIIFVNLLLMIYWLLTLQRIFWIHFFLLLIGYSYITKFYKLDGEKAIATEDVKIMSYNVRMFNKYDWSESPDIPEKITTFIKEKSPDIICFQDYAKEDRLELDYKYKYEKFQTPKSQFGQAIYSKYPIVNKGSLDFEKTANNIIYADLLIGKDTARIYNVHLQSIKLNLQKEFFGQKDAEELQMRISQAFQMQQEQVEKYLEHQSETKHKIVIAGDFNNTGYSWVYRKLKDGKNDAYVEAGVGFDKTYDFQFPLRIDFFLVDKSLKINYFKTYKDKYSDHFPILVRIDKKGFKDLK